MIRLDVLDSVTDAGHPDRENEDRLGWTGSAVFVVDGATGLGEPVVNPSSSDAAWLAAHAAAHFEAGLVPGRDTASVVRDLCMSARDRFAAATLDRDVERFRYPTAGFQAVRVDGKTVEVSGLGDCVLFLRDSAGDVLRWSPLPFKRAREQYLARQALADAGGFDRNGVAFHAGSVLADLRSRRSGHNVAGSSVWTLGLEPLAADFLVSASPQVALPATAVLCSDGFGDLVDCYEGYSASGLIAAAEGTGLAGLLRELRRIEHEVDPDGVAFPRYKRSDDASAVLFRLNAESGSPP